MKNANSLSVIKPIEPNEDEEYQYRSIEVMSVWDRLAKRVEEFKNKVDTRKDPGKYNLYRNFDPQTGQELFKPLMMAKRPHKYRSIERNTRDDLDPRYVGDYLYRHAMIMKEKKKVK